MAGGLTTLVSHSRSLKQSGRQVLREPLAMRVILLLLALGFLFLFLLVPLFCVFFEAFRKGWHVYLQTFDDRNAQNAIYLTLKVCAIVVPVNLLFGVSAAWALTKFNFRGKNFLLTLIDLPFAVSPVIAGLVFILVFSHTFFGDWLKNHGWQIVFNTPGIVLATLFVTFPFVARELIPLMQSQGSDEEQAAISLGASGWQTFWRVTLPNIKWGLLHGVVLCNARAMGEFGAVSVVSGHIQGKTNTIPLHIEVLYESPDSYSAAFAMASLLTLLALITLIIKTLVERKHLQR